MNPSAWDRVPFARLSEDQARRIHEASLEILERMGVRLHHPEAIDLLRRAGAEVSDGNRVRVPSHLVEKAFTTAPQQVLLYDRYARPSVWVEGSRCSYGPGSDCMWILDHRTGVRRRPVVQDVVDGVTLCDALPHIDFVMSMVLPSDVAPAAADTVQAEAMLAHTTKPAVVVSYGVQGILDAVEMAEAVAGGPEALRRAPLLACYINVVSGVNHNAEALQKLLYLAGKALPALYIPASTGGVTSPVTPAGAVALDNAGVLLGLVLSQLRREGAPFIMTGMQPSPMDMRTLVTPYVDPQRGIFQALARLYRLPCFGWGGVSDSKAVDQQAAAEAALTLLAESMVGGNLIHDLGYLESGLTFSLAQLTICDELVGWIDALLSDVDVSDEALALDVIEAVGPEGHYLAQEHTRRHFRQAWSPALLDRQDHKAWQAQGGTTLGERAAARVDQILAEHRPEPLPDDVRAALQRIVARRVYEAR